MARLNITDLLFPAGVGAISAGAELFSQNYVAHPPVGGVNELISNAGMAVDVILPVAAVLNHMTGAVLKGRDSSNLMAAAVAIGVRRGTTYIGHKVLKLNVTPSPGAFARSRSQAVARPQVVRPRARREIPAYDPGRAYDSGMAYAPPVYTPPVYSPPAYNPGRVEVVPTGRAPILYSYT